MAKLPPHTDQGSVGHPVVEDDIEEGAVDVYSATVVVQEAQLAAVTQWFLNKDSLECVKTDTLPHRLAPGKLYVLGEAASLQQIAMQCPYGCGERVYINLLPTAHPCFSVTYRSDGTVSLYPTIQRERGCRSHFFVRRSRVYWWNIRTVDDGSVCSPTYSLPRRQVGRFPF
jgi:hypothetical protein